MKSSSVATARQNLSWLILGGATPVMSLIYCSDGFARVSPKNLFSRNSLMLR
ncbi:hypothetical protein AM1_B0371 (plasmid) [Acaryochloris marina MBIC11017]|uniref:Uncharacterized protein n=1 Tax=Acaryochloris marina (strain MBIC 11017) TaxID=329726 RepID=A8ZLR2_ACAM1|nr:hypothetical protein AM1_B0371 [Acaryochloris marina MBIC11017]